MAMQMIDITIKSAYWGNGEHAVKVGQDDSKVYLSGFFGCTSNYRDLATALSLTAHRHGFELVSYTEPRDI
jgi:hypothetical protein